MESRMVDSRASLKRLRPEDVIRSEQLKEYTEVVEFIWAELLELRATLYVMERVRSFPFADLLLDDSIEHVFFPLLLRNFSQVAVQTVDRLWRDGESFTLVALKKQVLEMAREERRPDIEAAWTDATVDPRMEGITTRVMRLRHQAFSHRSPKSIANLRQQRIVVDHDELVLVIDEMEHLFRILTFETQYLDAPIPYSHLMQNHNAEKSDIERVLDAYASYGALITMKETNPWIWPEMRRRLSAETVSRVNAYRRMRGLPEIE